MSRLRVFQVSAPSGALGPARIGGEPLANRCFIVQRLAPDVSPDGSKTDTTDRTWLHIARGPSLGKIASPEDLKIRSKHAPQVAGKCGFIDADTAKQALRYTVRAVDCLCVLGLIDLPTGQFMALISEGRHRGSILGRDIFAVSSVDLLPLGPDFDELSVEMKAGIEKYHTEIVQRWLCDEKGFIFSFDYDVTRTLQNQPLFSTTAASETEVATTVATTPTWASADRRFFWNRHATRYFVANRLFDFIVPVMRGHVDTSKVTLSGRQVALMLVSRVSCLRAGTRYNARGVNDDGNAANSVETEQIVTVDFDDNETVGVSSFVQVRGSVPVFWEQKMIRGKHRTALSRGEDAARPAFKKHFATLVEEYGRILVVNLLGSKPDELIVSQAFENQLQQEDDPMITYHAFDFHAALGTSGKKFGAIGELLLNPLQDELLGMGVFVAHVKGGRGAAGQQSAEILLQQTGSIRTNCLDCLDRTNVAQGAFAQRALYMSLVHLQALPGSEGLNRKGAHELPPAAIASGILEVHKILWANNGDAVSLSYTGTAALKSDLTRTGNHSLRGVLSDGVKSVKRTYLNNFKDDEKQHLIDYFLGSNEASVHQNDIVLENELVTAQIRAREAEYTSRQSLTVFVGTWNVNGRGPGEDLASWIYNVNPSPSFPDVYMLGFQEIVKLTGKNVWNADTANSEHFVRDILFLVNRKDREYVVLKQHQLVGVFVCVIVRKDQLQHYTDVHTELAKVGFVRGKFGAGNKGGIAVRFQYLDETFCCVVSHFAAGHNNVEERNSDYGDIIKSVNFRTQKSGHVGILEHNYVFWFGDLNYRLNLEYHQVRRAINAEEYSLLKDHDQLREAKDRGQVFPGFMEGPTDFAPTYKFDTGTDIYDTSEKRRIPAWTDRILFKADNIKQYNYRSSPLMTSDHKPVSAVFGVSVKQIDRARARELADQLVRGGGFDEDLSESPIARQGNRARVAEDLLIDITSATTKPTLPPKASAVNNSDSSNPFFSDSDDDGGGDESDADKNRDGRDYDPLFSEQSACAPPQLPPKRAVPTPAGNGDSPPRPAKDVARSGPPTLPPKASSRATDIADILALVGPPPGSAASAASSAGAASANIPAFGNFGNFESMNQRNSSASSSTFTGSSAAVVSNPFALDQEPASNPFSSFENDKPPTSPSTPGHAPTADDPFGMF